MATLAPVCRGCSRPIILRNTFQSIGTYNQTTQGPRWLQLNCARISRRLYKVLPPGHKPFEKLPPKPPKPLPGQQPANVAARPKKPITSPKAPEVQQLSFAELLASNPTPTTLYEAAPQKMFLFSSYLAGVSCILGGATNIIVNVYNIPEGLHFIVPVAFGVVGVAMAMLGTRLALVPSGVVRYIKVVPTQSITSSSQTAKAASPSNLPVQLEIEVRHMIPFTYRRFRVNPHDVVMPVPLYNMTEHDPPDGTLLPRDGMFQNFRRGITGEGFAPITVNGAKYKLDITSAYVLDEGRALDRIVKIVKNPDLERIFAKKREP